MGTAHLYSSVNRQIYAGFENHAVCFLPSHLACVTTSLHLDHVAARAAAARSGRTCSEPMRSIEYGRVSLRLEPSHLLVMIEIMCMYIT
jgi:hypothetical protein